MNKILSVIISAMLTFFASGCDVQDSAAMQAPQESAAPNENVQQTIAQEKDLTASFIDVGQGDCEFIELPNGQTVLIDTGESGNEEKISSFIHNKGYSAIDYFIMTHPHADHIGSSAAIIKEFDIKNIYMPKKSHTSKTFENMLDAVSEKGYSLKTAKAGVSLLKDDSLSMEFLAPVSENYDDLNNYSAVLRIKFKNNAFLFMGDAEKLSENEILNAYPQDLKADVIKIGHHGSSTSSGEEFIKSVSPKFAVISCGRNNSYSHPHSETISLLNKMGINIYRTDESGTITVTSDGDNITVDKQASSSLPNAPPGSGGENKKQTSENDLDAKKAAAAAAAALNEKNKETPPPASTPEPTVKPTPAPQVTTPPQNSQTASAGSSEKNSAVVYKTRTGECYHNSGCSSLKKSKIQTTVSQAKAEGLRACKRCKPPQ